MNMNVNVNTTVTRTEAEDFLYHEARLLDEWKLVEWAALFTEDGEYLVPPLDAPESTPGTALFLIYDDKLRLTERAKRLLKRQAHAEFPHSVLSRLVGNVLVEGELDGAIRVHSKSVLYRSRAHEMQVFPGRAVHDLQRQPDGSLRIRRKRAIVDTDSLRLQGRISIIL
jgi:p-cumate 2,3-dioxygenase beta subunit